MKNEMKQQRKLHKINCLYFIDLEKEIYYIPFYEFL